ncbi:MAG TPA: HAD family hydrolase [Methylophaga sp.]|nr:HAD family hydrolase [Methylophaga sp.]
MSARLYALDFDGVICDSAMETGLSAWRAARRIWPELPIQIPEAVLAGFREVRPALETGFESILINRSLYDGTPVSALLNDFAQQIDTVRQRFELCNETLKSVFGKVRDSWIEDDFASWIANNPLYPGMADFLQKMPPAQLFIITTKQERFVSAILEANAITLSKAQIYGLERRRSKSDILGEFAGDHRGEICFIEDRLPTLLQIVNEPHLDSVDLWLADWGYNTQNDRQTAEQSSRINTLALQNLHRLLN